MNKKLCAIMAAAVLVLSLLALGSATGPSSTDKVRLYIQATTDDAQADLHALDVRHEFADGVVSVEVSPQAAEQLENNPRFTVLGQATQWHVDAKPGSGTATRQYTPSDQTPWGMQAVYNDPALTATSGGAGVTVAVLDTGAKKDHFDLKNRIVQCKDFTRGGVRNGCNDVYGHGTHVAGTIAADGGSDGRGIYGVAPEASLYAYKVCGNSGLCWSDDVAAAIAHAADQGANIVSMSLGGSALASVERNAIDYAVASDVLVIAAAGNSGPNLNTIGYPGAYVKVVAVAALNSLLSVADFSSRGVNDGDFIVEEREVEIAMPGVAVESTWNDGGYRTISGTSMATPHASGLAARHWQGSAAATRTWLQSQAALWDITSGQYAAVGDDPASGLGFATVG
ncbi:MAG TPA: S8 family serine peptidase [Candidatus Nanoarchaeia archaeon]|nr:S8 family serine peptidase [Candidatus Nanoarchaeia archaeon]